MTDAYGPDYAPARVLGAPTRKLALWMIAGVWLWTIFYYGVVLTGATWIAGMD